MSFVQAFHWGVILLILYSRMVSQLLYTGNNVWSDAYTLQTIVSPLESQS